MLDRAERIERARHFRLRAKELRKAAREYPNKKCGETLTNIAADYDSMADGLETIRDTFDFQRLDWSNQQRMSLTHVATRLC